MSMIEVNGLSKSFNGQVVFQDVSMQIEKGETIVIIGPSGCGKSTFLRCLNRMVEPTSGSISIMGQDILNSNFDINELRAHVGMVYQQFYLFSHLNVLENMILAPMKVRKISKQQAIDEAVVLLRKVGLDNRLYHMPSQLSGGQKQRVAIMRCLMMKPEVILFDEPTSALDPTMVDEVEYVIRSLVEEGMTSLIVTHEMSFARSIATKVAYLDEMGLYEMGTPQEIFDVPKRPRTRMFVDKLNVMERELSKSDDLLTLMSDIRAYCVPYGFTDRQMRSLEAMLDEIVFAVLRADTERKVGFRLFCSAKTNVKEVVLIFDDMQDDPLKHNAVDELGLKILKGFDIDPVSERRDSGWSVTISI